MTASSSRMAASCIGELTLPTLNGLAVFSKADAQLRILIEAYSTDPSSVSVCVGLGRCRRGFASRIGWSWKLMLRRPFNRISPSHNGKPLAVDRWLWSQKIGKIKRQAEVASDPHKQIRQLGWLERLGEVVAQIRTAR